MMPCEPIACAATPRPHLCASSTAASSSSGVKAVNVASIPGVRTPPVAMTLITRAPALISSRTARRTSSGESTSRASPMLCPCPPVIVSARPAAITRGPGVRPSSIARPTSQTTASIPPRSRTVVTPACRCRSALRAALIAARAGVIPLDSPSKSACPSKIRWTWQSINPGVRVLPSPSTSEAARATRGARACAPTHWIVPPATCTPCLVFRVRPSNTLDVREVVRHHRTHSGTSSGPSSRRNFVPASIATTIEPHRVRPRGSAERRPARPPNHRARARWSHHPDGTWPRPRRA